MDEEGDDEGVDSKENGETTAHGCRLRIARQEMESIE